MFSIALVLLFIIKLRFPRRQPISVTIEERYGRPTLLLYRRLEKLRFRTEKIQEDLKFLKICKDYRLTPNFLKFKLYSKNFSYTRTYKSWQFKLLDFEIRSQESKLVSVTREVDEIKESLHSAVLYIDYRCLLCMIDSFTEEKLLNVRITHKRKLRNLGIDIDKKIDINKVIFNFSKRVLTLSEKNVLSLGLDFGLTPCKINYTKFFLGFEKLCDTLKKCALYGGTSFNSIFSRISVIANDSFRKVCRENEGNNSVNKERITLLKNLKEDENIVITKPDKGRGVVILDMVDYNKKMHDILSDSSKCRVLNVDIASHILKLEDKLNRTLRAIKSRLGETIYTSLYASGSRPGTMYGLPKIHKVGNPLRPIISSTGTFSYSLAKFLVPVIKPLTFNNYTIENSSSFVKEICNLVFDHDTIMASFDIVSLFTNIPLHETTDIICNNLEGEHIAKYGLEKSHLSKLLDMATCDSIFMFDNQLYNQIDGVGMGNPLGPVYANSFMCHTEKQWLADCPVSFKPLFYRRYVDDTFLIFRDISHVDLFLSYLNSKHPNIKFTSEVEENSMLSFLDVLITRRRGSFTTSVYRKNTFTGLGLNYLGYSPMLYKINSIRTLINRAYNVCSDYFSFDMDMTFLLKYFTENLYPSSVFYNVLKTFLNEKLEPKPMTSTVEKEIKYVKLPYVGHFSYTIRKNLQNILKHSFPQMDFRFVFTNSFTIGSFFKKSSTLPVELSSCIVYLFTCPQCNLRYVGSSTRWLKHRIQEHRGRSFRTNLPLTSPPFSAIREHSLSLDHTYTHGDFSILTFASNRLDLVISESLLIRKMKPTLNNNLTAFQLSLSY